jgi:putative ABC transport system substrate-binding protein
VGTLRALLPGLKRLIIVTSDADIHDRPLPAHDRAARAIGVSPELVKVKDMPHVAKLLASMRSASDAAWFALIPRDGSASQVAAAALARRIASHGMNAEEVRAGMLMSYWLEHSELLKHLTALIDKVLRGADPGSIPFQLPDKEQFALNRATAKALGIRIPDEILVRATEVIG